MSHLLMLQVKSIICNFSFINVIRKVVISKVFLRIVVFEKSLLIIFSALSWRVQIQLIKLD
jgi:hypothetical protein